ncbi:hypothetical protein D9M71_686060 [compost metagenome]
MPNHGQVVRRECGWLPISTRAGVSQLDDGTVPGSERFSADALPHRHGIRHRSHTSAAERGNQTNRQGGQVQRFSGLLPVVGDIACLQ